MSKINNIILRRETKPFEHRTALTPSAARALMLDHDITIQVESCNNRVFSDSEYRAIGCEIIPAFTWYNSTREDELILGLKELSEDEKNEVTLNKNLIYFAHIFKGQEGADEWLEKFSRDGGKLYDLEFLVDENKKRIAAFGFWAGYTGAAIGLDIWLKNQLGINYNSSEVTPWLNKDELISELQKTLKKVGKEPRSLIIGASGRCGRGAKQLLEDVGLYNNTTWGSKDTAGKGPFPEILDFDILHNCVYLRGEIPPFITAELLKNERNLNVISDISCDPNGPYNPIPIYSSITTMDKPCHYLEFGGKDMIVTAIDHLPSLLPRESSEDFCDQLMPFLGQIIEGKIEDTPWQRSLDLFNSHLSGLN